MKTTNANIMVIGSLNMDVVIRCQQLPLAGQTVLAESSTEFCGGKGANQAVAAAKAGGNVQMVGCVGNDAFASRLRGNLTDHCVDDSAVKDVSESASGLAVICVDQAGQNSIVVVPGANHQVDEILLASVADQLAECDALLLQMEIPMPTVLAAIQMAREAGVRVILDPAPAPMMVPDQIFDVDLICPNESEASALVGHSVRSIDDAAKAADILRGRGANCVAITMGNRGAWLSTDEASELIPAFAVDVLDTTAAGDAWVGAAAVWWCQTGNLKQAVSFANAAGALAASRKGTQASLASREEIECLWQTRS